MVTTVSTVPAVGDSVLMVGGEIAVKARPLLSTPLARTTTLPVVAPAGTGTLMVVAVQLVGVAAVALNRTVPVPWVAPKPVPVIVITVPTAPDVGDRLEMLGVATTVKLFPLLLTPLARTTTFPFVAPAGTVATRLVADQLVTVAVVVLNFTVLVPCVAPKFDPTIVTDAPIAPDVGDRLATVGAGTTVKGRPLLAVPDTVTTTFPVDAPLGTVATMVVAFQLVVVAVMPLNLIVLVPLVVPKPVPVIVTEAATAPVVGAKLEIAGAAHAAVVANGSSRTAIQIASVIRMKGVSRDPANRAGRGFALREVEARPASGRGTPDETVLVESIFFTVIP